MNNLLTYIINDKLELKTEQVPLSKRDEYITKSIDIGVLWLTVNVLNNPNKFKTYEAKINHLQEKIINNKVYTLDYNRIIINTTYYWLKIINTVEEQTLKMNKELDVISKTYGTDLNINPNEYIMVEISPGIYHNFVKVRYNHNYDYLPYNQVSKILCNK